MALTTRAERLQHVHHELTLVTSLLSAATERANAVFGSMPSPSPGHRDRVPVELWSQLDHVTGLIMAAEDGAAALHRQLRSAAFCAEAPRPTTQIHIQGPAQVLHRR